MIFLHCFSIIYFIDMFADFYLLFSYVYFGFNLLFFYVLDF